MKLVLVLLMVWPFFSIAQTATPEKSFEQTKAFIIEKIRCCSVDFTKSAPSKVSSIDISEDGTIILHYLPEKAPQTFNLFDLYKPTDSATGIELSGASKFVQFHVSEFRTRLISFATHEETKEVHAAFIDLLQLCKPSPKAFSDLNFQQTIDVINIRLEKWSNGFKYSVSALPNGQMIIYGRGEHYFRMNLLDLKDPAYSNGMVKYGIGTENCDYRSHAPSSFIHFFDGYTTVGFLKLKCAPETEIDLLQQAFLRLRSLCKSV